MTTMTQERGPIYGVPLIEVLPLNGGMLQAMPSFGDLHSIRHMPGGIRIVAGYEVLLARYSELKAACRMLFDADHPDHFAARLSESEMAAMEAIRIMTAEIER